MAVDSLAWNEDSKTWTVTTRDVKTNEERAQEFNIVKLSRGPFTPHHPPEFESFVGLRMHSAGWNDNVELENQVVGVVGTGSSAVQVIPNIAPKVRKLIVYMREPNYVYPKFQMSFSWITKFCVHHFAAVDVGIAGTDLCGGGCWLGTRRPRGWDLL